MLATEKKHSEGKHVELMQYINSSYHKFAFFLCKFCISSDIAVYIFYREIANLQRTNDEQKGKISENERQILENKGRILVMVLSVLLQFTDSDYPFGIFKLFLKKVL